MKYIKTIIILTSLTLFGIIIWLLFINNKVVSTITLNINPSIEINLDKQEKVINVKALNEDAKSIVSKEYNNKTLDETFELLITNLIDKDYVNDNNVNIILYTEGNIEIENVTRKIEFIFGKEEVHTELTIIDKITKEDKSLAKKYHITPAKAAYINSIAKDIEKVNIEALVDKSVRELVETKETGNYCDKDYTLEGSWCIKEIDRVTAKTGEVCPSGYYEYENKCYEEAISEETSNLICRDEFKLEGETCIRRATTEAIITSYSCPSGEVRTKAEIGKTVPGAGDANDPYCVDANSKTHPVTPCNLPASDPTERMSYGGKCYWHRAPVIAEGCPGKVQVNGMCWDEAVNIYLCPNGNNSITRSKDDYCYEVLSGVKPVPASYKCDDADMTLTGSTCIKEEQEEAMHERICPSGYTLVNHDRCINYNRITNKENGFICESENTKLKDNICIIYEMVEAKH